MSRRKAALVPLGLGVALLALALWRWSYSREMARRMDFCRRVQASCLASSLLQEQAFIDLLAKPKRGRADRAAALQLIGQLRDCWRYAGDLAGQVPADDFFVPFKQAEFWLAQSVHVSGDSLRLDPHRDAPVYRSAMDGMKGNLAQQRRNLAAFAEECRSLPWAEADARGLDQWAQSLRSKP